MVSTKLITIAGRCIATELKDLPPLKKGFVRLTHWTHPDRVNSIVEHGLYGNKGLGGTTLLHGNEGVFWEDLTSAAFNLQEGTLNHIKRFGNEMIVMDMPEKEFRILDLTDKCYKVKGQKLYDYGGYELLCPSKYIVGAIEKKYPWGKKCIELFRQMARRNPEVEVQKTDLRMFNGRKKVFTNPFAKHSTFRREVSKEEGLAIEKQFEDLFNEECKSSSENVDFDRVFNGWDFA